MRAMFQLIKGIGVYALISIAVNSLAASVILGQTISTNVRVSDIDSNNIRLYGSKHLAAFGDNVYAVWQDERNGGIANIFFSKSTDRGATFSAGVRLNPDDTLYHMNPSIAVNNSGIVYIAWNYITVGESSNELWNIMLTKSTNGGNSFDAPKAITSNNFSYLPCIGAYQDYVFIFFALSSYPQADYYLIRSTNAGENFDTPIKVNDADCVDDIRFEGLNSLHVDSEGNIHMAWIDGRRAGGKGDIFYAKSTDNGATIGTNVMVNDPTSNGADSVQYKVDITAESENVYVAFSDTRLGEGWGNSRAYFSKSTNGGSSFSQEVLLSGNDNATNGYSLMAAGDNILTVLFVAPLPEWNVWLLESNDGGETFPLHTPILDSGLSVNTTSPFICCIPDGPIYSLWLDSRFGDENRQVFFSKIIREVNVREDLIVEKSYRLSQNYPNPFNPVTNIQFKINDAKYVSLSIYNILGQKLYEKIYTDLKAGIHNFTWSAVDMSGNKVGAGVYFYKLQADDKFSDVKKMILLK